MLLVIPGTAVLRVFALTCMDRIILRPTAGILLDRAERTRSRM
jgi:hypothetical protein